MHSKVPYIKPKYYLGRKGVENLILACYDELDNCITGFAGYTDFEDKRPVKEMLYKAYYRANINGNLRVNKYL